MDLSQILYNKVAYYLKDTEYTDKLENQKLKLSNDIKDISEIKTNLDNILNKLNSINKEIIYKTIDNVILTSQQEITEDSELFISDNEQNDLKIFKV